MTGIPAISGSSVATNTETTLATLTTENGTETELVGASSVFAGTGGTVWFYQSVNPGSTSAALSGLSLTTAVPNHFAKFAFPAAANIGPTSRFCFFELFGDDAAVLRPIRADGSFIDNYQLTLAPSDYGPVVMTTEVYNRSTGDTSSNLGKIHGTTFSLADFQGGSGGFSGFVGFALVGLSTVDPILLGAMLPLEMTAFTASPQSGLSMTFRSIPGNRYEVRSSPDLSSFGSAVSLDAASYSTKYTRTGISVTGKEFFRVHGFGKSPP